MESATDMKSQPRIFVRTERCVGCHNCELACAVVHSKTGSLTGAISEDTTPRKRIFVEAAQLGKAPVFCLHCGDAPCVRVCPVKALAFDPATGVVQYAGSRCIGCSSCAMACPFGVIQEDTASRTIVKCDLCVGRDIPACVKACLTKALQIQPDYERNRRREVVDRLAEALHTGRGLIPGA